MRRTVIAVTLPISFALALWTVQPSSRRMPLG